MAYFTSNHTALVLSERGTSYSKANYTAGWLSYSTDGRYTADDIVEKVAGEITPAEMYYGLIGLLGKKSYITEAIALFLSTRRHSGMCLAWNRTWTRAG